MDENYRSYDDPGGNTGESFDWHDYYHAVIERLWVVILCLVLGGIAAALHLKGQETQYQARSVLFLEQQQVRVLGEKMEGVTNDEVQSLDMINTIVDILRGYPFAKRVVEALKLDTDPQFLEAAGVDGKKIDIDAAETILQKMVLAGYRKNTRLIDIFMTSRDPALATKLANAYATEYLRYILEQSTEATRSAGQFLVDEADRLGKKMRLSEEAMQSFRERERATSLETMLSDAQSNLTAVTAKLTESKQRLTQLEADLAAAKGNEDNIELLIKLPSVAADTQVAALNHVIDTQEQELVLISQRYRHDHPIYLDAITRHELATKDRADAVAKVVEQFEVQRTLLQTQNDALDKTKQEDEKRLLDITGKYVEYNSLKRDQETDRAFYEAVLNRLKEVDITKGLDDQPIRIHELAQGASAIPVALVKTLGMGLFLGLAAGIAIALGLNKIDPSIRTVEQTERVTGLKVIAAVPQLKDKKPGLVTVKDRHGMVAEAFRTLRTSLALVGAHEQRHIFLFTSAVPSEGKTFSSANFAATLAQQGFRTLYIDADLRKPSVSELFYGENRKPGLAEILLDKCSISEALQPTELDNLSVITAGGRASNPAELLAHVRFRDFLAQARKEYERVVIDSAPVIAVSDTLLLAEYVDVSCIILRARSTSRKSVNHAIRLLTELGCPPAGIVLNRVQEGVGGYYAYSGRNYGNYGAKGVYGRAASSG